MRRHPPTHMAGERVGAGTTAAALAAAALAVLFMVRRLKQASKAEVDTGPETQPITSHKGAAEVRVCDTKHLEATMTTKTTSTATIAAHHHPSPPLTLVTAGCQVWCEF